MFIVTLQPILSNPQGKGQFSEHIFTARIETLFSVKGQRESILIFLDLKLSTAATQLCHDSTKSAISTIQMNEYGYIPKKTLIMDTEI